MSIHIGAKPGDIAETVLMPGDPLRAKYVAENYLENPVCYNTVRNMLGFTGTYKGKRISVQGSGMGIPSIAIYATELFKDYGVKQAIRIGSCGSLNKSIKLRDIILAMSASTDSNYNQNLFKGLDYSPTADFGLLKGAYDTAVRLNIDVQVGQVFSSDNFYVDDQMWWVRLTDHGVLGVEMETTALYTIAAKYGVKALTILTVSDSIVSGDALDSADRETSFTEMMEIALETVAAAE